MGAAENVEFVRRAYEAMMSADLQWMAEHTADDVVFHQGGHFPTAGTYHGRDAMFGHYMEFMTMVEGKFSAELIDILASEERTAAVISVTIGYEGRELRFDEVHLWRLRSGKLVELHALPFDPYEIDEFLAGAQVATSDS